MAARRFSGLCRLQGYLTHPLHKLKWLVGLPLKRRYSRPSARRWNFEQLEDRALPSAVAIGPEFRVNTSTSAEQRTFPESPQAVAMDLNGNFVVTWSTNNQDGSGWGVYAQRYNAAGVRQGAEFPVNTTTTNNQQQAVVGIDANGNFVIAWMSLGQDGSNWGIYAQRYNASGVAQGTEFQVNTTTALAQTDPSLAMDPNGNFVITWSSSDGDNLGIYAQRYNASGVAQGTEFQVNTTTYKAQEYSSVDTDASGNFVVTWSSEDQDGSNSGVYA